MGSFWKVSWRMLLEMEGRGVEQDLLSYVGILELAIVPVEGWIIYPDVHGLFYCPSDVMNLPIDYGEVVYTDVMTSNVTMVTDGERGPEVFLEPSPKVVVDFPIYSSLQSSW